MSPKNPSCLTRRQGSLDLEKIPDWDAFISESDHWRSRNRFLPVSVLVDCFLMSSLKGGKALQSDCPHSSSSMSDSGYHRHWLSKRFTKVAFIPWQRIAEEAWLCCAQDVESLLTDVLDVLPESVDELGEIAHREAGEEWAQACFRALGSMQGRDPRIYLERLLRFDGIKPCNSEVGGEAPDPPFRPGGSLGFDEWALECVLSEFRRLGAEIFPYVAKQYGEDSEKTEAYETGIFKEIGVGKLPSRLSDLLSIERLFARECPEYFRFRVATNSLQRNYSSRRKPRSRLPHFLLKVEMNENKNWFRLRKGNPGGMISIIRASLSIVAVRLGILSQHRGWILELFYRRNHPWVGVDFHYSDSHAWIHRSEGGVNVNQMLLRITECLLRVHPEQNSLETATDVVTIFLRVGDVAPSYTDEQDGLEIPIIVEEEGVKVGTGFSSSNPTEIASAVVNLIFRDIGFLQEAVR